MVWTARLAGTLLVCFVLVEAGQPQSKLEPVAETRLLMEGLANPNFRGLERHLSQQPSEVKAWVFARGQALIIAETANLLLLRPPRSAQAQPLWFQRATDLRQKATTLAETLSKKDYAASRSAFVELANTCNRCHQSFRVPIEIAPFAPVPKTATPGV
jgi:hypothetical protein